MSENAMAMLVCPDGISSILNRAISQGLLCFFPLACTITLLEAKSTRLRLHYMMVKWIYHICKKVLRKGPNLLSTEWATWWCTAEPGCLGQVSDPSPVGTFGCHRLPATLAVFERAVAAIEKLTWELAEREDKLETKIDADVQSMRLA